MKDSALNRISTRTFKKEPLSNEDIDKISSIVFDSNSIKGPFDHSFEFTYYLNKLRSQKGKKIGTYGLIKNPPLFVGGTCNNDPESIIDYGYSMQRLILEYTKNGYNTCWLGGTFNRKHFKKDIPENEIIPAITPVGYAAESRSIIDKSFRSVAQSNTRFSLKQLFKRYDGEELTFKEDNVILQSLSLVRRGPSASNKQPWRGFVDDCKVHYYIKRTPRYPAISMGYDIQLLDMGIALCNFSIGLEHYKQNYAYFKLETPKIFEGMEYIISVDTSI
jgi:hypothetical protein